jgi:hypothetical protein
MMREALSDAQWAAARGLVEGERPTHTRVAACMGVHVTTVSHRASDDGWKGLDFRHERICRAHGDMVELAGRLRNGEELDLPPRRGEDDKDGLWGEADAAVPQAFEPLPDEGPQERLARIGDTLSRRADAMLRDAENGRPLEARQVQALSAMVQLTERIAGLTHDNVVKQIQRSDDELAEQLEKIDNRIVELGHAFATEVLMETGMSEADAEAALKALSARCRIQG